MTLLEVYGSYYFPYIRPGENIDLILIRDLYGEEKNVQEELYRVNEMQNSVKMIDVGKESIDYKGAHIPEPKEYDKIWIDIEDIDCNKYQVVFRTHPSDSGIHYCIDEVILTDYNG